MPERARVQEFIRMVESGDHVRAIEDFYHPQATMRENCKEPRRGRDTLVAHEKAALARVARVDTHPVHTYLIDGDNVVVQWTFEFVDAQGGRRRMEELALQSWQGDRIIEERFYYDPASIVPVTA